MMSICVVTLVGASLIENYNSTCKNFDLLKLRTNNKMENLSKEYSKYKAKEYSKENYGKFIKAVSDSLTEWIKSIEFKDYNDYNNGNFKKNVEKSNINQYACAEINSLIRFAERKKQDLDVYLLSSDTVVSCVLASIIAECFDKYKTKSSYKISVHYNLETDRIKDLQMENYNDFLTNGFRELINRYSQIEKTNYGIYFNITSGYKGVVPLVNMMGLVYEFKIFYLFNEQSSDIVEMPQIPIAIDESVIEKHIECFFTVYNKLFISREKIYEIDSQFLTDESTKLCFDYDEDGNVFLNPLGELLYSKCRSKFAIFYMCQNVFKQLEKNKDDYKYFMGIIGTENWKVKGETAKERCNEYNGHRVVKDKSGGKDYRIYYINDTDSTEEVYYIYKYFNDHGKHEEYYNSVSMNNELKNSILENAKFYCIKKEEK